MLSLAEENRNLRKQIEKLNEEFISARENDPGIQSFVEERVAFEVRAYKMEKDAQTATKLQKKDEHIARLENRLSEAMATTRRVLEDAGKDSHGNMADEVAERVETGRKLSCTDFEAIEESLKDQKVYILGGHANWRKKIKAAFPYIPIIATDRYVKYGNALENADIIIVNTFHCSHKAYAAVVDAVKKGDAKLVYVEKENNPNGVGQLLMKSLGITRARAE